MRDHVHSPDQVTPPKADRPPLILVLWNQVQEDVYQVLRDEGPQTLAWDPNRKVPDVGTVEDEMQALLDAIRQNGYRVACVNVKDDLEKLLAAVTLYEPALIFNLVEYIYDDETLEPAVAALYDLLGVPYTGSPPQALATCQNKYRTKILLDYEGLPTSPFFVASPGRRVPNPAEFDMDYPIIVKPAREDASGGIETSSVVLDYEQLVTRCEYVFREFEQPALCEEYIEGREIHAAILGNNPPVVLPLFEMEFDDSEFNPEGEWRPQIISYNAKWDPHSKAFYTMDSVCPPEDLEPEVEQRIKEVAVEAFKLLGCRDYARVDMRVDEEGDPFILEVNPNPDLADGSAYVMCAEASGRSYAQIIGDIVRLGLARRAREHAAAAAAPAVISDHLLRRYAREPAPARPARADTADPGVAHSGADGAADPDGSGGATP